MPISVVIAAHDEEPVIGRCLEALLYAARPDRVGIVVVCNDCTDRTAPIARGYGANVNVIGILRPSKNGGAQRRRRPGDGFPRFYVYAGVTLPLASVRRIAAQPPRRDALAAFPVMELDVRESRGVVRDGSSRRRDRR